MPKIDNDVLYSYPQMLRDNIAHLPSTPGVYFFWAEDNQVPLYIGKSINIRSRVLSHLRTIKEAKLLRQTREITCVETAGDIGAQLLEAKLIKQLIPLHNKRLRKQRTLYTLMLVDERVQFVTSQQKNFSTTEHLYGLFRNKRSAQEFVRNLADEHRLCLAVLGCESAVAGRACFRSMLGKCQGACCGKEHLIDHSTRLHQALAERELRTWPYRGRIAIHEQQGERSEYHIIDNWRYITTVTQLDAPYTGAAEDTYFDADSYRILCKAIFTPGITIIELE